MHVINLVHIPSICFSTTQNNLQKEDVLLNLLTCHSDHDRVGGCGAHRVGDLAGVLPAVGLPDPAEVERVPHQVHRAPLILTLLLQAGTLQHSTLELSIG